MKLKTKIHLFSTLLMLVILACANIGIYFLFEKMSHNTEYHQLLARSKELTTALSSRQLTNEKDADMVLRAYVPANGAVRIVDQKGSGKISTNLEELRSYKPSLQLNADYSLEKFGDSEALSISVPIIWTTGEVMQLEMTQLLTDVADNLKLLRLVLVGVTILAMIPIVLSSMTLGRIVTQPINKLTTAMKENRLKGTYEKIDGVVKGKDELAQMERTFNDMMEQLADNYQKQEQFVSNASHELKTPLTVIESYTRLLQRQGFENRSVAEEAMRSILNETGRMKELIAQMLELAKSNEHRSFEFKETDVFELLKTVVQPLRQGFGRDIHIKAVGPVIVSTDEKYLKQLLFILLDNARKYSEREIDTAIMEKDDVIEICVTDYGRGIPKDHLPHLFDRFYRVETDRNRKTGGTGIGLSIAKELADGLDATLVIESVVEKGTTFRILIPKKG